MRNMLFVCLFTVLLAMSGARIASGQAAAKPLGEQELSGLLAVGLDDQTLTDRIARGIDFEPSEEVLARLKRAGASDVVLKAVQKASQKRSAPSASAPPAANAITYDQMLLLVSTGIDEQAILNRLSKSPTIFTLSPQQIDALKEAGATDKIIAAMTGARAASSQARDITDLAIILDCSGSMREKTSEGQSKMAVAQQVVTDLVQKIPAGINLAFVIYGHEVFGGADDPRNCQAVKVVRPLSPLDDAGKSELTALIANLRPTGATPIALSLRTAGQELKKNDALCGLVLVTDGLESCKGDPEAEAAALAAKLKIAFGVNVVGFGVSPAEDAALKAIADAGKGKYYSASSAKELAEKMSAVSQQIAQAARKPDTDVIMRRALKFLQPEIEMPPMGEIVLIDAGKPVKEARLYKKGSIAKYGEELRIPSSTAKYDVVFYPQGGEAVLMMKGLTFPERKLIEVKPEEHLGLIRVKGEGTARGIHASVSGSPEQSIYSTQRAKAFGDVMIVPVGKYDVYSNGSLLEEGLVVEAGKLYDLE